VWLSDLLDENRPIPDPSGLAPQPPPEPEPMAPAAPVDEDDFLPPPPPRLLRNLFEPDPDDPMVQAMRAAEAEREGDD
jgi:hypothetical protein